MVDTNNIRLRVMTIEGIAGQQDLVRGMVKYSSM